MFSQSLPEFSLASSVMLATDITTIVHTAAGVLLGTLAVTSFLTTAIKSMITPSGDMKQWIITMLLTMAAWSLYFEILTMLIDGSTALTTFFQNQAHLSDYLEKIPEKLSAMFTYNAQNNESSFIDPLGLGLWESMIGMMRGGLLSVVTSISYFVMMMAHRFVLVLSAVATTLLTICGPLMIVGSLVTNGKSLQAWFSSFIHVMLWPIIPPLLALLMTSTSGNVLYTSGHDNTAFIIAQNIILSILCLLSPLMVSLLMGKAGVMQVLSSALATGLILTKSVGIPLASVSMGDAKAWTPRQSSSPAYHQTQPSPIPHHRPGDNASDERRMVVSRSKGINAEPNKKGAKASPRSGNHNNHQ